MSEGITQACLIVLYLSTSVYYKVAAAACLAFVYGIYIGLAIRIRLLVKAGKLKFKRHNKLEELRKLKKTTSTLTSSMIRAVDKKADFRHQEKVINEAKVEAVAIKAQAMWRGQRQRASGSLLNVMPKSLVEQFERDLQASRAGAALPSCRSKRTRIRPRFQAYESARAAVS